MTDKSDDRWGVLKFRLDERKTCQGAVVSYNWITNKIVFGAIFLTCAVCILINVHLGVSESG